MSSANPSASNSTVQSLLGDFDLNGSTLSSYNGSVYSLSSQALIASDMWTFVGPESTATYLVLSESHLLNLWVGGRIPQDWSELAPRLTLKHLELVLEEDRAPLERLIMATSPRTFPTTKRFDLMAKHALERVLDSIELRVCQELAEMRLFAKRIHWVAHGYYTCGAGGGGGGGAGDQVLHRSSDVWLRKDRSL